DPPDPYLSAPERHLTVTPAQSLVMINGPYVMQRAQALAGRIEKLGLKEQGEVVAAAYQMVFGREPSAAERKAAGMFLSEQTKRIAGSEQRLAQVVLDPMVGRSGTAALFKPDGRQ